MKQICINFCQKHLKLLCCV